jgi:transposase
MEFSQMRVQEVIPVKKSRAYRSTSVNKVDWNRMNRFEEQQVVHVGLDIGKFELMSVLRWPDGNFERPWEIKNPSEIGSLVDLLFRVHESHQLTVAMEPTGTYGDAVRQALDDAGLCVHRVSPKASHDYAEVFDGVPSQHDGKDAAVVAELSALGKSGPWRYEPPSLTDQEMSYWVDWMDAHRRQKAMWIGRLEGLLARHWPEATRILKLSSSTLLRVLEHYGGPGALGNDDEAINRVKAWGGPRLTLSKVGQFVYEAQTSMGVRQGTIDVQRMQQYARQARTADNEIKTSQQHLKRLIKGNKALEAQGAAIGIATACVLWVHLGDPSNYHCGAAYRKAMGLNLKERSSGTWKGKLAITKRGSAQIRSWLFFAALRLIRDQPVKKWYDLKKAKDNDSAKRALVGVMRKLALALYQIGAHGQSFDAGKLFPGGQSVNTNNLSHAI